MAICSQLCRGYEEFAVKVPIFTWKGRQFVRVSIQGCNTRADVDALVATTKWIIVYLLS